MHYTDFIVSSLRVSNTKSLILSVENLCVSTHDTAEDDESYFSDIILKNISFQMYSGDRIAIVGTSGSGKTTLLKAIAGVLPHSLHISGLVCMQEDNVAYIMQEPKAALNPIRTVKNMFLALRHRKRVYDPATRLRKRRYSKQYIFQDMYRAFETMNLFNSSSHDIQADTRTIESLLLKRRTNISGGMAQRIMVALAITAGSQWALADEVSSALDEIHERKTIEILLKLMKGVLFVTHRMRIVKSYCNKVLELKDGEVHFFGTTREWLAAQGSTQYTTSTLMHKHSADEVKIQGIQKKKDSDCFSRIHGSYPILHCEGISACYAGSTLLHATRDSGYVTTVFQNIDFAAQVGEVIYIRGETGCGKSTFAHICAGYLRPSSGIVCMHNKPMPYGLSRAMRIFRRDVQLISQVPSLSFNPLRSVLCSVMDAYSTMSWKEKKRNTEQLHHLCEKMHIAHKILSRFPHQLSGGQLQRISLIRALLSSPKILILDEPVSHLDAHIRVHILELIRSIYSETGITLIMISHLQDVYNFLKRSYSHFTSYELKNGTLSKL